MKTHKIVHQNDLHFLTLSVVGWINIFSRKRYRDILVDSLKYCCKHKGLRIVAWCIMSNHVHLICYTVFPYPLSNFLRDFKKYTSKKLIRSIQSEFESRREWLIPLFLSYGNSNSNNSRYQFWQQYNHPIHLESQYFIIQKIRYIHLNPVKSGLVVSPEQYIYSSAPYYAYGTGLLELDVYEYLDDQSL